MKKLFALLVIFFVTTTIIAQQKQALSIDDLWNLKRIGSFDVSQDGSKIIFDATSYNMEENKGKTELYSVSTNGGAAKKVLNSKESVSSPQFLNDANKIIYSKNSQIFQNNIEGSSETALTDFYSGVSGPEYSWVNSQFIFSSHVFADCQTQDCNEDKDSLRENNKVKAEIFTELMYRHWNDWRGPKISHLFLFDVKTNQYTDLTLSSKYDVPPLALGSANDYSFSPDGGEVALTMNKSDFLATSTNNDVFILQLNNLKNGEVPILEKISTSMGNDNQPVYSPNGRYIAYSSMERAGFEADKQRLMLYDRFSKNTVDLTKDYDLSVGELVWAKDSKSIYFIAANKIYNSIFNINIDTKLISTVVEKVVASSLKISGNGETLFFLNERSTLPKEIFSINTDRTNFKKITDINGSLLSSIEMNEVETFWTKGAEEVQVQSILLKPPFFNSSKKYPLMFLIHGGPQGHWEDDFHFRWNLQMFAAQGYVVVATNPRGSTGYGQKFTDEISGDWGGKVYTDLMNSYDYAINTYSFIDKQNTFAAGASYGGYMINWIEGHTDRFNALICHAGVYNLESMYGTTEELWFPEWENGGTPWEKRELYQKWSPNMFVQNFKTPMLVIHGAYDFRVPFSQAMELFTALQRVGVKSKMLYFPDEYHFITKPQNARLWWNSIYEWLEDNKK